MVGIFKKTTFVIILMLSLIANADTKTSSAKNNKNMEASTSKIASVDLQTILEKATVIKNINTQNEKLTDTIKEKFNVIKNKFDKENEELTKSKSTMSDDAYNKKSEDLEQDFMTKRDAIEGEGRIIGKAHYNALTKIQDEIIKIIANIAQEKHIEVVLPKSITLYIKEEITSEVIDSLNNKISEIKLDVDAAKKEIYKENKEYERQQIEN